MHNTPISLLYLISLIIRSLLTAGRISRIMMYAPSYLALWLLRLIN